MLDFLIIGAGPNSLSLISHLLEDEANFDEFIEVVDNRRLFSRKGFAKNGIKFHRKISPNTFKCILRKRNRNKIQVQTTKEYSLDQNNIANEFKYCTVDRGKTRMKFAVIDKTEDKFLSRWNRQFEALGIKYLRSTVHQLPDSIDPNAILVHAKAHNLEDELYELDGVEKNESFGGPFLVPGQKLFNQYLQKNLIKAWNIENLVNMTEAKFVKPIYTSECLDVPACFEIQSEKFCIRARHIVVAAGNSLAPNYPSWTHDIDHSYPSHRLMHFSDFVDGLGHCSICDYVSRLMSREKTFCKVCWTRPFDNQTVCIVGGGQTAAHLIQQCMSKLGAKSAWLVCRSQLRVHPFDLQDSWMYGPTRTKLVSKFWKADNLNEKISTLQRTRFFGASIMPKSYQYIAEQSEKQQIRLCEGVEISTASWNSNRQEWNIKLSNQTEFNASWILLATGNNPDGIYDLFQDLEIPREANSKYPRLNDDLSLCISPNHDEKAKLYLMGPLACLKLGPGSQNLMGAKLGGYRVAKSLKNICEKGS